MKQILFVVVDSGAIYSTMLFILLVVHLTSTTTEYLLLDAVREVLLILPLQPDRSLCLVFPFTSSSAQPTIISSLTP